MFRETLNNTNPIKHGVISTKYDSDSSETSIVFKTIKHVVYIRILAVLGTTKIHQIVILYYGTILLIIDMFNTY